MKFIAAYIIAVATVPLFMVAQSEQEPNGFYTGRSVGRCLISKCRIFRGVLVTDTPPSDGQPVQFHVLEEVFGPEGKETVQLPYYDPSVITSYDQSRQAWKIKSGVSFSEKTSMLVGLAMEDNYGVREGEAMFITSDEGISETIRYLAKEAKRINAFPEGVSDAVATLNRKPNGPLAGYLFTYITRRLTATDLELVSSLLSQLIESPSVPPAARQAIGLEMMINYSHLSPRGRSAMIARFVDLALNSDIHSTTTGLLGLAHINDHFHNEVNAMISPLARSKLLMAYRAPALSTMPRNQSLEKLLGTRTE